MQSSAECVYDLDDELAASACPSTPVPRYVTDKLLWSDPLTYMYTSGTTGLPKAATVTHWRYVMAGFVSATHAANLTYHFFLKYTVLLLLTENNRGGNYLGPTTASTAPRRCTTPPLSG